MKNLLQNIKPMNFGTPQSDEVIRNTVVAVVVYPRNHEFLCQYWDEYKGLTCLLSGGVEDNEDADEAMEREIVEETGYTDFTIVGRLGSDIEMHYTKATGEKYLKKIVPYFVILNSLDSKNHMREEDEKFDNLFKQPSQILAMMSTYESVSGSSLDDHKEILRRGMEYLEGESI